MYRRKTYDEFILGFFSFLKWAGTPLSSPRPRPHTHASHPPAGGRASCLAERGDGAADGWEDDRSDQKESLRDDKSSRGNRPGIPASVGKWAPLLLLCAAVRSVIPPRTIHKYSNMSSRQLSESRAIPTRRVLINDTTQLPHDYCTTPGGTLFSTTPGGMWSV